MNKNQNTKKTLRGSLAALFLCVVLLIGTTFAWFTDSVSSGTNVIKSGNLDISATVHDLVDWTVPGGGLPEGDLPFPVGSQVIQSDNSFKLGFMSTGETVKPFENNSDFMSDSLFEPGKTHVKLIRVKNDGDLAAKIKLNFDVQDGGLQDALWFAIDGPEIGTVTRTPMSDLNNSIKNIEQEILSDDTLDLSLIHISEPTRH